MTEFPTALLIVDVQNDFCEGGSLAVPGGQAVAAGVTDLLRANPGRYARVYASRDWHLPNSDNDRHFALDRDPDYATTWPVHCVQGTAGAEYHPALDPTFIDEHVIKGMGEAAYSATEGVTTAGDSVVDSMRNHDVWAVDVVGIATDYCVKASVLGLIEAGFVVRVLTDLTAGVAEQTTTDALTEMVAAGAAVATSDLAAEPVAFWQD